jgi:hypothetical protein
MSAPATERPVPTPCPPVGGNCPQGGDHALVPVQGGGGMVCAKCGARL